MRSLMLQVIAGADPADPITIDDPLLAPFRPADRPQTIPGLRVGALERDGLKGRAHRRAAPGLRARHDGSGDREGVHRSARRDAEGGRRDRRSCAGAARRHPAGGRRRRRCGGFKYDINRYLASHGERVPVKSLAGHHQVAAVPSDGPAPPRAGAGRRGERAGQRRRARRRRSIASRCARRSRR